MLLQRVSKGLHKLGPAMIKLTLRLANAKVSVLLHVWSGHILKYTFAVSCHE